MNDDRLDRLERRLQRLEDEHAIQQLIASYGPLVDSGESGAAAALWAIDGTYDVEDFQMRGRNAVRAMVNSNTHQGLIARGSAHFLGPAVVRVNGDHAVALCESVLFVRRDNADNTYVAARAAANHFRLRRVEGRWQIVARTTNLLDGSQTTRRLLSEGVLGA